MNFHLALITGATSGIGEALARLLSFKKIPLLIVGRNRKKLQALKKEFSKNTQVTPIAADLSKKQGREKIIQIIRKRHPDLIVNCAGVGFWGEAIKLPKKDLNEILETNIKALVDFSIEGAKSLVKHREEGVILNLSSAAGELTTPKWAAYGASKAFILSFSKAMDLELESYGVRVLVSRPGVVKNAFASRAAKRPIRYTGPIRAFLMKPEVLAKRLWKQITKRKRSDLPDKRYFPLIFFSKISPEKLNRAIYYKLLSFYEK